MSKLKNQGARIMVYIRGINPWITLVSLMGVGALFGLAYGWAGALIGAGIVWMSLGGVFIQNNGKDN